MSARPRPRAWVENNVAMIRSDVPAEEAAELSEMLRQAFNAGVICGYNQRPGAA